MIVPTQPNQRPRPAPLPKVDEVFALAAANLVHRDGRLIEPGAPAPQLTKPTEMAQQILNLPGATIRNFGENVGPLTPPAVNDSGPGISSYAVRKALESRRKEMSRIPPTKDVPSAE